MSGFQHEETEVGAQALTPGVRPVTLRDRLAAMAQAPMLPKRRPNTKQQPCDVGLFDEAGRAQIDLADLIGGTR